MGWLGKLLTKIAGESPEDFIFAPSIPAPKGFPVGDMLEADKCYVELYVESLRLAKARKFATEFNGVVYTFVTIHRDGEADAQLAAISKPERLVALDPNALDKVMTVSKKMMGAAAWRGGTFSLELGLFSVKSGNVLTPMLDFITKVSSTAGIAFVGAARPFVPLIVEGMNLIAGQRSDTAIEVALDTDLSLRASGVSAIIAAPKGSIDVAKLAMDTDGALLLDGKAVDRGYCVFSIRRTLQKADFGEIPELRERYAALQAAIKANKRNDAQEALVAFRLAAFASPDLISADAKQLVAKAEQKAKDAFGAGGIAKAAKEHSIESLASIGLYTG